MASVLLWYGHNLKKGVLGTGTIRKSGVLGTDKTREKGELVLYKRGSLIVSDGAQKGVLVSLFINFRYFCLVYMINWWGFALTG